MDIIVCDDERLARERLVRILQQLGHRVVAQASNGLEALEQVKHHHPEVIFLDIRMPEMNGLESALHLSAFSPAPAIIFCTAYDQYAMDAFKSNTIAYLLKPASIQDVENALQRATQLNQAQLQRLSTSSTLQHQCRQHISARSYRGLELIPVDDIYFFQADQKYVMIRHKHGQLLIDETLKDLEHEFQHSFIRIHRNALLSLQYIEGLEMLGSGQYQVRCKGIDEKLLISRRHLSLLKEKMQTM